MNKKLLTAIFITTLFLSSAFLIAQAEKPDKTPPDIEKIVFIHREKKGKPGRTPGKGPGGGAGEREVCDFQFLSGKLRWKEFPIPYEVNSAGSGLVDDVVLTAMSSSSETWDAQVGVDLFGIPTPTSDGVGYDGKNVVIWDYLDPGIIAVTTIWYNPKTKTIVEFDIKFNKNYMWAIDENLDSMDVQNIATHELGHNGLGDLYADKDSEHTMYGYSSLGETKKRTLECGDIDGIKKLYG